MITFSDEFNSVKKQDRVEKSGIVANFGPKIRTVPLKGGQLVSMRLSIPLMPLQVDSRHGSFTMMIWCYNGAERKCSQWNPKAEYCHGWISDGFYNTFNAYKWSATERTIAPNNYWKYAVVLLGVYHIMYTTDPRMPSIYKKLVSD